MSRLGDDARPREEANCNVTVNAVQRGAGITATAISAKSPALSPAYNTFVTEDTMSTTATGNTAGTEIRILCEGYGEGAWHGPDLKAALADVTQATAYWRPAPGRHNIAEVALHHAYYAHAVRAKLSEVEPEPF